MIDIDTQIARFAALQFHAQMAGSLSRPGASTKISGPTGHTRITTDPAFPLGGSGAPAQQLVADVDGVLQPGEGLQLRAEVLQRGVHVPQHRHLRAAPVPLLGFRAKQTNFRWRPPAASP